MRTSAPRSNVTAMEARANGALFGGALAVILTDLVTDIIPPWRIATVVVVAGVCALTYERGKRVWWTALCFAALFWLTVALSPLSRLMTRGLLRNDRIPDHVSAVVVLSGSVTHDGMLTGEALDRLLAGEELLRRGVSHTLVTTQPNRLRSNPRITPVADQQRLFALLPAGNRMIITPGTTSTRTEALHVAAVIAPGDGVIALVTSPLHTRRACRTFEAVGFVVACVAAESRDIAVYNMGHFEDRLAAFRAALYERAAWLDYARHGWLDATPHGAVSLGGGHAARASLPARDR